MPTAQPPFIDPNKPARPKAPREGEIWATVQQLREHTIDPPLRVRLALSPLVVFGPKGRRERLSCTADELLAEISEVGLTPELAFDLATVLLLMRLDVKGEHLRVTVTAECAALAEFLCVKNLAYGNSAHDPIRCFSDLPADAQMLARMDDKLSRIARGQGNTEDTELDLIGYLVLWLMGDSSSSEVSP